MAEKHGNSVEYSTDLAGVETGSARSDSGKRPLLDNPETSELVHSMGRE